MSDDPKPLAADAQGRRTEAPMSFGEPDTAENRRPSGDTNLGVGPAGPPVSMGDRSTGGEVTGNAAQPLDGLMDQIDRKVFAERFDLIAEIRRGGMGCVLKAFDRKLQREVAVKRIRQDHADSGQHWRRFLREAQFAARLSHPNLVTVYDVLIDDEGPYLILELVDGETLADLLQRGPLPWREAVELLLPVCLGVAFAHERGIIHRDIKPSNILLPKQGSPKLGDFGIARAVEAVEITRAFVGIGTLGYMAPEQSRDAKGVDFRADLYSLGATLYHMTVGTPFGSGLSQELAAEIAEPVKQALQYDRERRQASVPHFIEQLQQCLTPHVVQSGAEIVLLREGECPACRTVNPPSRRYCRKCNQSLQEPCPACAQTTFAWDRYCGECGVDVAAEWKTREQAVRRQVEHYQQYFSAHDFAAAAEVLREIDSLPGERWAEWRAWAANAHNELETAQAEKLRWCEGLLVAARADFEACRFEQAVARLEQIPAVLITDEAAQLLEAARPPALQIRRSLAEIGELDQKRDFYGMRRVVDAALRISPQDRRLQHIDQQLRQKDVRKGQRYADALYQQLKDSLLQHNRLPDSRDGFDFIVTAAVAGNTVAGVLLWVFVQHAPAAATTQIWLDVYGKEYDQATLSQVAASAIDAAVKAGDPWAMKLFADAGERSGTRSRELYQRAAERGNPSAATAYACRLLDPDLPTQGFLAPRLTRIGTKSSEGIQLAMHLLQSAHQQGHAAAEPLLAFVRNQLWKQQVSPPPSRPRPNPPVPSSHEPGGGAILLEDDDGDSHDSSMNLPPVNMLRAPFTSAAAQSGQAACAKSLGAAVKEKNSIGMELVLIPPGEFEMGTSDAGVAAALAEDSGMRTIFLNAERPLHRVWLTKPFRIGACPVTQQQFQRVMGRNPSHFSPVGSGKTAIQRVDAAQLPVEFVTWFDALEFCNRLSMQEKLPIHYDLRIGARKDGAIKSAEVKVLGGNGYRLPTEAEWEYACRAGTTAPFCFGSVCSGSEANIDGNQAYGTKSKGTSLQRTSVVGSYPANSFGLHDMHGNVLEWCSDWFDAAFYGQTLGTAVNPCNTKPGELRVIRGGSWFNAARDARSANRGRSSPENCNRIIGFRVARTQQ